MNILEDSDFVYALGNFMADGSFYVSDRDYRFEFVDGSPYKDELVYSSGHINHIKSIFERLLSKKLHEIRQRENRFVLKFRDKNLASLFIKVLKIKSGPKDYTVDIPKRYVNTPFERIFWVGYLDGDGSIARDSRRIALESVSSKLINSFASYLEKQGIFYSKYKSKRADHFSYVVLIKTVSFRDFASKIGFYHPLKLKLLNEKLEKKDSFITNEPLNYEKILIDGNIIDYLKIFDDSVFIENGIDILRKYGYKKYHGQNVKLSDVASLMTQINKSKIEILKEINNYRFKKSKGSTNSVILPLYLDPILLKIARFIRIRPGNISFSKRYTESFNENFDQLLKDFKTIFDIDPKYTSKSEPLFCSGVLSDFFNSFIINKSKTIKT